MSKRENLCKKKHNKGQRHSPRNSYRWYKFPRHKSVLKEFEYTHQSMSYAWKLIELEWMKY